MTSERPETGVLTSLHRIRDRVAWRRLGALLGVVTLGFSEIYFSLIGENPNYFPSGGWFYFWLIVWVQVVPVASLFAIEWLFVRWKGEERLFRIWRGILYVILFLSFARQFQVHYPDAARAVIVHLPVVVILFLSSAVILLAAFRSRRVMHQYASLLGILGVLLTGTFLVRADAFGRGWTDPGGDTAISASTQSLPPIYLLLFDELSHDILMKEGEIDADAFPHFAALARDSVWFTNATTNHLMTERAIPTMLSGLMDPGPDARPLFDRLPSGYEVVIRVNAAPTYRWIRQHARDNQRFTYRSESERLVENPFQIPSYLVSTWSQSPYGQSPFAIHLRPSLTLLPPLHDKSGPFTDHLNDVEEFLESVRTAPETPRFTFWHCWLPHHPFRLTAEGKPHEDPNVAFVSAPSGRIMISRKVRESGEYKAGRVVENYREQVKFVDRQLGRFVEALRASGEYDRAIIVVTSDHGLRSWGETEPDGYPEILSSTAIRIPLVVRAPGLEPGRSDVDYQHLDLVPTILGLAGFPDQAADTEGVSAFAADRPARPKTLQWIERNTLRSYTYDPERDLWNKTEER